MGGVIVGVCVGVCGTEGLWGVGVRRGIEVRGVIVRDGHRAGGVSECGSGSTLRFVDVPRGRPVGLTHGPDRGGTSTSRRTGGWVLLQHYPTPVAG